MRAALSDPHVRLLRAIRALVANDPWLAGWLLPGADGRPGLIIEGFDTQPWASLTFVGTRHELAIRLVGDIPAVEHAYDRLQSLLVEPEMELAGHFLAELAITGREGEVHTDGRMSLAVLFEALTIEE